MSSVISIAVPASAIRLLCMVSVAAFSIQTASAQRAFEAAGSVGASDVDVRDTVGNHHANDDRDRRDIRGSARLSGVQASAVQASADQASADQASADQASADQASADQASADQASTDHEVRAANDDNFLTFNFRYAPWEDVLKWYADEAGLTLDLNEVPQGTFNYYDTQPRSLDEALDVLNGYLLPKGYLLVRRDNFLTSVNIEEGVPPNLVPNVRVDQLDERGANEMLSVVLPLRGLQAREASEQIGELVGPQGRVTALTGSNAVAVTDIGSNLRRIRDLLDENLATQGSGAFRSFSLRFLTAVEARRLILELFSRLDDVASTDRNTSPGRAGTPRPLFPDSPGVAGAASDVRVAISPRTNSVLVRAEPSELQMIEEMLEQVDVRASSSADAGYQQSVRVIPLTHVSAGQLQSLPSLLPGVSVSVTGEQYMPRETRTADSGSRPSPITADADEAKQPENIEPPLNDDDRDD